MTSTNPGLGPGFGASNKTRIQKVRERIRDMKSIQSKRDAAERAERLSKFRSRSASLLAQLDRPSSREAVLEAVSKLRRIADVVPPRSVGQKLRALERSPNAEVAATAQDVFERLYAGERQIRIRLDQVLAMTAAQTDPDRLERLLKRADDFDNFND